MRSAKSGRKEGRSKTVTLLVAGALAVQQMSATEGSGVDEAMSAPEVSGVDEAIQSTERKVEAPEATLTTMWKSLQEKAPEDRLEREKLALKRLNKLQETTGLDHRVSAKAYFDGLTRVNSDAKVDNDVCLTVPVRSDTDVYNQVMYFKKDELATIRGWLMNVSNDHIRAAFPGAQGEKLISMKVLMPNEYMRHALVAIAQQNDTIRSWLFRNADLNHPLWNSDNTIKKEMLPEGWTTVNLKGSGEAPILKEDEPFTLRLQDAYFWRKVDRTHPLDRRFMAMEYDPRRNPNGWIFDWLSRYFNVVRPSHLDKDYFFPHASEQPFNTLVEMEVSPAEMAAVHSRFLVKNPTIGRILGDVPVSDRPLPALSRNEIMELGFRARLVKTVAEGGDYDKPKKGTVPEQNAD